MNLINGFDQVSPGFDSDPPIGSSQARGSLHVVHQFKLIRKQTQCRVIKSSMSRHQVNAAITQPQCRDITLSHLEHQVNVKVIQLGQPTYIRIHFVEIFKFKSNLSSLLTIAFSKSP